MTVVPSAMTSRVADSTRSAASVSPRCRSISAPDRISAVGLALSWPAYFGAEPWTGSKTAARSPMFAPGANIGDHAAVFEPVHGSAPKYAGQNKANPTALILSGALMLRHLGETEAAGRVESAVRDVIAEGTTVTYDLGGSTGTREFGAAVAQRLAGG